MMSRKGVFFLALLAGLVTVGAGCGQGQVAIPPQRMNEESALSATPPVNLGDAINAATQQAEAEARAEAAKEAMNSATGTKGAGEEKKWSRPTSFPGVLPESERLGKEAVITTDKGRIVFEILGDVAPKAASNFIALARSGFYDGLRFHRVVPGFVIQGGDPLTSDESQRAKWGTGGPGYKFEDELVTLDYKAGIVAMANSGADTNGSQFFIVLDDQPTLPKQYTIFGRVTAGMDVVRQIVADDVMRTVAIEESK